MKKLIFFLLFLFLAHTTYSQEQATKDLIDSLVVFEHDTRPYRYAFEDSVQKHTPQLAVDIDSIKCIAPHSCQKGESMLFRHVKNTPKLSAKYYRDLNEYLRIIYFRSKVYSLNDGILAPNEVQYEFVPEGVRVYFSDDVVVFRKDDVYLSRVYRFFVKQIR